MGFRKAQNEKGNRGEEFHPNNFDRPQFDDKCYLRLYQIYKSYMGYLNIFLSTPQSIFINSIYRKFRSRLNEQYKHGSLIFVLPSE